MIFKDNYCYFSICFRIDWWSEIANFRNFFTIDKTKDEFAQYFRCPVVHFFIIDRFYNVLNFFIWNMNTSQIRRSDFTWNLVTLYFVNMNFLTEIEILEKEKEMLPYIFITLNYLKFQWIWNEWMFSCFTVLLWNLNPISFNSLYGMPTAR